jgi:hypothetical protein
MSYEWGIYERAGALKVGITLFAKKKTVWKLLFYAPVKASSRFMSIWKQRDTMLERIIASEPYAVVPGSGDEIKWDLQCAIDEPWT